MFRNYLAMALRNLARNRLYAGVTIAGLAVGFAAALLIGLYVRDELTYDRFVPGHRQVYLFAQTLVLPAAKPIATPLTPMMLAKPLKADFSEIAETARLSPSYFPPTVRRGDFAATEQYAYWADPQLFRVLPLPALAGDLSSALEAPDGVVVTRAIAQKYFGRDAPLGETLQIDGQPMRVTAVLKDLPSNTNLTADIIASGRAAQSPISRFEHLNGPLTNTLYTYVQLKPGATAAAIEPRLAGFLDRRLPLTALQLGKVRRTAHLVPLGALHLSRLNQAGVQGGMKTSADPAVIGAIGAVGVLIVAVAAMNFVTLMTARGARRAVEVGVRKAAGASRGDLIVQFLSEAGLYIAAAGLIAAALSELSMPAVNALLQRRLALDWLHDPALLVCALAVLTATGLLAGFYPAFVLSGFRPSSVLKGGAVSTVGGGLVRQVLVVGQFAVLIALALVAITIARQTLFALNEGMRVDKDQVLLVFAQPCSEPFRDEVRKLPGVRSVGCASYQALNLGDSRDDVGFKGREIAMETTPVDFGFFEVFGVKPLAGRLFERSRAADGALDNPDANAPVVLNETAVRQLGFASPQAAIGKTVAWRGFWDESLRRPNPVTFPAKPSEIVGVVPDFTLGSVRQPILPTLYSVGRNLAPNSVAMAAKLDGARLPETLAAIDGLWKRYGQGRPILRVFTDRFTLRLYLDTLIQGATVAVAGIIALSIAALGLFALSAYTTERRTKEIGVRKAMGASSGDILKLLIWQFTKPVLWANLIAWPAAFLVLRWWLAAFAYHVDVAAWTFLAAGAAALLIAWATVFVHALNVARSRPVGALRYE